MRRIHCAKQLLVSADEPVKQISENVGFSCPDLFYRVFKKYVLDAQAVHHGNDRSRKI